MSTKYSTNNHNSKRNVIGRSTSDRNNTTSITPRKASVPRTKKQRRVHPAVKAFFLTLAIVVGVGMVIVLCISLPRYLKAHKTEEFSLCSFVEAIPETLTEDNGISLPDNEEPAEAESKYDDLRNYPDYLAENNIFFKDAHKEGEVTLGFTGDVLFDDEYAVMAALIQRGNDLELSITPDTLKAMNDMDIMVINNEFPFTEGGTRQADKQYTFRADYSTAPYLQQMGVDAAILANNHVFDFGEQGLLDTLKTMDDLGIQPLGAGRNITEAMTPTYYIVNDIKIALIAATDIERLDYPDTKAATEDSAGVLRSWNNNEQLVEIIKNARENADFVIVCIHWGTEKEEVPDYYQKLLAPKIAEAGADIIIGDHPHRLQGVYYYNGVPCIYSLGNFWFNGFALDTGMVEVTVDNDGLKALRFLPAVQANYSTGLVYDSEKSRILNYMRMLSPDAVIDEEGYITPKQ